ncbi:MAG: hypothetical protein NZM38_00875 [Cytophagales bacterium]|nr:hypothetical protein [Cytophagales bacterium]MDW8383301.1 hypothetical protein [Flammeovirgaceae bacterium]
MNLPKQTRDIFEILSKGQFICSMGKYAHLYDLLKNPDNFDLLYDYFQAIGFCLESGNGYFYFSKIQESTSDISEKLLQFERYIDILDLFASLDSKIKVGDTFTPAKIAEECADNPVLRLKLKNISTSKRDDNIINIIRSIVEKLEKETFIEKIDEEEERYKVLDSFQYLEQLVMQICINESSE